MNKKIKSPLITALKEALSNVFWYKYQLKNFLIHCISNPSILTELNWNDYKRNIVSELVDYLVENQEMSDILTLIEKLIRFDDFTHLENLDGGKYKAIKAKETVKTLKKIALHTN
ncbi:hypothetical protein [Bacillus sp. 1P02SD]|uniref:hypothetical protein n=1 Tax=Bacillus sp. 1P02SD TaxID=3132264 RepID=UPI00399FD782